MAIAETIRTRSRWVIPFMALVVAGNGLITTTVKELADRARPHAQPDRGDARAIVPERPFVLVGGVLRRHGAAGSRAGAAGARGRLIAGACAAAAVSVAATRVLLDVHWLSDVIAGLALGSAWFCVCAIACGGRLLRFGAPAEQAERKHDSAVAAGARRGESAPPIRLRS